MRKWFLIVGICLFIITLCIDVKTDLQIGDKVNHLRGALLRLIGLIPSIVLLVMYKTNRFPKVLLIAFIVAAMVAINYSNLFDGFYNILRGFGWFFTGSENEITHNNNNNTFFISLNLIVSLLTKTQHLNC